jgi:hypothetical protein
MPQKQRLNVEEPLAEMSNLLHRGHRVRGNIHRDTQFNELC